MWENVCVGQSVYETVKRTRKSKWKKIDEKKSFLYRFWEGPILNAISKQLLKSTKKFIFEMYIFCLELGEIFAVPIGHHPWHEGQKQERR